MALLPQDLLMSFRFAAAMIRDENKESALAAHRMVEWAENELSVIGLNVSVAIEKGDPQRVLIHEMVGKPSERQPSARITKFKVPRKYKG
jgi:hypothetical protein